MNIKETVSHFARSFDQVESIVQALPFALVLTDQKGIVHYHNEIFERVVKKKHENIKLQTIDQFIEKKVIETIQIKTNIDIAVDHRSFVLRKEHAYVHGETYHLYLLFSIKQLELFDEKVINIKHLPEKLMTVHNDQPIVPLVELMEKTEREALQSALFQTKGNRSKAAKQLGISRTSFYEKLAKYQLN
ncbi:helix-turn-helix domain-containing protein [Alkalihalobacillus deserti]|uniref:helix-turn-helix domain-containing protein n=1 Tax=Alkalihalobacillus deserti TaxID=2879466 RepID=UPI001D1386AA|nr:helix-turn-helix domain-containing protein [Alkalihalobacillus deserti]